MKKTTVLMQESCICCCFCAFLLLLNLTIDTMINVCMRHMLLSWCQTIQLHFTTTAVY